MASMQSGGFFCIPEQTLPHTERLVYCSLCLASALLGLAGAAAQVYQWKPLLKGYKYRRKPSPNPMIVLCLAWADLLACAGVIGRSLAMFATSPPASVNQTTSLPIMAEQDPTFCNNITGENCNFVPLGGNVPLISLGIIFEALNQYFYGVTFMWTVVYAADIYLQLALKETPHKLYHVVSWAVPAVFTAASTIVLFVGETSVLTSCPDGIQLASRYIFYYVLIFFALIGDPLIYVLCNSQISKRMRESGLLNSHNRAIMSALRTKFLAVIVIFTVCWIPNVVDSFVQLVAVGVSAVPASLSQFFPIWALEAILNPLQGLLNCFVYGRHMLFRRINKDEGRITLSEDKLSESTPLYVSNQAYNMISNQSYVER